MGEKSKQIALCGMLCAAAIVIMLLGVIIPYGTYVVSMFAGMAMIPVCYEYGPKQGVLLWIAISLLSLMLVPDKEMALMFAFLFGWYPIAKPYLDKIKNPLRWIAKLAICDISVILVTLILKYVLGIADEVGGTVLIIITLVIGNITFIMYDMLVVMLNKIYVFRLRKRLFKK